MDFFCQLDFQLKWILSSLGLVCYSPTLVVELSAVHCSVKTRNWTPSSWGTAVKMNLMRGNLVFNEREWHPLHTIWVRLRLSKDTLRDTELCIWDSFSEFIERGWCPSPFYLTSRLRLRGSIGVAKLVLTERGSADSLWVAIFSPMKQHYSTTTKSTCLPPIFILFQRTFERNKANHLRWLPSHSFPLHQVVWNCEIVIKCCRSWIWTVLCHKLPLQPGELKVLRRAVTARYYVIINSVVIVIIVMVMVIIEIVIIVMVMFIRFTTSTHLTMATTWSSPPCSSAAPGSSFPSTGEVRLG